MANQENGLIVVFFAPHLVLISGQYISEFGFVEPFEEDRTELFRITEDVTRTSELINEAKRLVSMTYLSQITL